MHFVKFIIYFVKPSFHHPRHIIERYLFSHVFHIPPSKNKHKCLISFAPWKIAFGQFSLRGNANISSRGSRKIKIGTMCLFLSRDSSLRGLPRGKLPFDNFLYAVAVVRFERTTSGL